MGRFDGAMVAVIPLSSLQPDIDDPALPEGSQAALTDARRAAPDRHRRPTPSP